MRLSYWIPPRSYLTVAHTYTRAAYLLRTYSTTEFSPTPHVGYVFVLWVWISMYNIYEFGCCGGGISASASIPKPWFYNVGTAIGGVCSALPSFPAQLCRVNGTLIHQNLPFSLKSSVSQANG